MPTTLLTLPLEIRLQIYADLLLPSSHAAPLVIQHLFVRANFQSAFRNKTPPALPCQILRTCRQVLTEGSPVLYGGPHFDCASCIAGVEKLSYAIGARNFGHIRRLTIDRADLVEVVAGLREYDSGGGGGGDGDGGDGGGGMFRNLEWLSVRAHRIVDLGRADWMVEIDVEEVERLCRCARQIIQRHPLFGLVGQDSSKDPRSWADAMDESNNRVRWRFIKSTADLMLDEHALDLDNLSDLASAISIRGNIGSPVSTDAIPEPLKHGMRAVLYPS